MTQNEKDKEREQLKAALEIALAALRTVRDSWHISTVGDVASAALAEIDELMKEQK